MYLAFSIDCLPPLHYNYRPSCWKGYSKADPTHTSKFLSMQHPESQSQLASRSRLCSEPLDQVRRALYQARLPRISLAPHESCRLQITLQIQIHCHLIHNPRSFPQVEAAHAACALPEHTDTRTRFCYFTRAPGLAVKALLGRLTCPSCIPAKYSPAGAQHTAL